MLGPVVAEYSIIPHAGNWEAAKSYKQAHDFNAPLTAVPLVSQRAPMRAHYPAYDQTLAPNGSLVAVEGDLLLSALKKAEDRDALVVRFVNEGTAAAHATVKPIRTPKRAYLVNLKEEPLPGGELPVATDGTVTVPAKAWQIVTLALEF